MPCRGSQVKRIGRSLFRQWPIFHQRHCHVDYFSISRQYWDIGDQVQPACGVLWITQLNFVNDRT